MHGIKHALKLVSDLHLNSRIESLLYKTVMLTQNSFKICFENALATRPLSFFAENVVSLCVTEFQQLDLAVNALKACSGIHNLAWWHIVPPDSKRAAAIIKLICSYRLQRLSIDFQGAFAYFSRCDFTQPVFQSASMKTTLPISIVSHICIISPIFRCTSGTRWTIECYRLSRKYYGSVRRNFKFFWLVPRISSTLALGIRLQKAPLSLSPLKHPLTFTKTGRPSEGVKRTYGCKQRGPLEKGGVDSIFDLGFLIPFVLQVRIIHVRRSYFKTTMSPILPVELEREIFELAFSVSPENRTPMMLVACRVHSWYNFH